MIGEIIAQQYEVTALLGAGSMGEVYKGWDRALGRHVAIKVLKPHIGAGTERFRTEAKILGQMSHGNICPVYSLLEHWGRDIMVLQHLDGTPLDHVLTQQGRLPWSEVKAIAADVLAGLTEAHHAKVVHRDLKPANLMRVPAATGYKTVIMDFGIARAQGQARATREGMVACTIEYASPEQIQGEVVGSASDLYSLGMVLYELLTGDLAFSAKTDAAWAHAHVYESPDWDKLSARHGKAVVQFLRVATAKQPAKRYPDAQAMLSALRQLPDETRAQEGGVLGRLMSDLSQTLNRVKTRTRPSQPARSLDSSRSTPKPQAAQQSIEQHANPAPWAAWADKLQEHWAMVFLGLMLLIGLSFVLLSLGQPRGGEAPRSPVASPIAPVRPAASTPPASEAPKRPESRIAAPVPANATLDLGVSSGVDVEVAPPPFDTPAMSAIEQELPRQEPPTKTSRSPRSQPRATSIE